MKCANAKCGKSFEPHHHRQRYCTRKCVVAAETRRRTESGAHVRAYARRNSEEHQAEVKRLKQELYDSRKKAGLCTRCGQPKPKKGTS